MRIKSCHTCIPKYVVPYYVVNQILINIYIYFFFFIIFFFAHVFFMNNRESTITLEVINFALPLVLLTL